MFFGDLRNFAENAANIIAKSANYQLIAQLSLIEVGWNRIGISRANKMKTDWKKMPYLDGTITTIYAKTEVSSRMNIEFLQFSN